MICSQNTRFTFSLGGGGDLEFLLIWEQKIWFIIVIAIGRAPRTIQFSESVKCRLKRKASDIAGTHVFLPYACRMTEWSFVFFFHSFPEKDTGNWMRPSNPWREVYAGKQYNKREEVSDRKSS